MYRKKSHKSYALDKAVSQLPLVLSAKRKREQPKDVEIVEQRPSLPPPQEGPQTEFYNSKADVTFFGGSAGGGKAGRIPDRIHPDYLESNETRVLTPNGFKLLGDIAIGDYVVSPDGKPTKVIQTHYWGKQQFYRVTTSLGQSVEATLGHLWAIHYSSIIPSEIKDWDTWYTDNCRLVETSELIDILEDATLNNKPYPYLPTTGDKFPQIINIETTVIDYAKCITVDNPKGLYVTDDNIITHNSFGLLLSIAKQEYLDANGYNAVIFRRSRPDLTNEGGIWDTANQLFPDIDGESNGTYLYYKFPPYDNRVRFSQLQHEKSVYRWKSSQITSLNFEELTEFSWPMFSYMLSRNRSNCGIKPSVRATMNPDADSWIAKFIEWYIGDDGYIIPERSGVIRYFLIKDNEPIWGDSLDELMESFGDELTEMADDVNAATGEDLVKPTDFIKSFTFIKADVFDNPALLRTNPEYLANLKAQHPVEAERLLKGNWRIKYDSGNVFNRAWLHVVDELPDFNRCRQVYKVRAWDLAASTKEANKKAFYTCGVLMYLIMEFDQDYFTYYVADMQAEQLDPVAGDDFIVAIANQDGTGIPIRLEQEGGSSGPKYIQHMHSRLSSYDFEGVRPMGDKLVRFLPFAGDAKNGRVRLVRGDWNHQYLSWLHSFDGTAVPGITDCADATSGCHAYLSQFDQVNALGWLSSV